MIGRRAVTGLSLLSALLLCAFAAQSASAAKAENTTAVTCVEFSGETSKDFKDAHCIEKTAGTGSWEHQQIPLDKTTTIAATNEKVTNETKEHEPVVLLSKVGLTPTEFDCTKVNADTTSSFIHNVETESKKHTLTGTVRFEYRECTVTKPAKCLVKEPIVSNATFEGVEGLGTEANTMGIEFRGEGAEETFAEITFTGAECALKEKTFKLKGSMIATSGPGTEASQNNKWAGATWVFTPKKEMQKVKLGVEAAEFHSIVTPTMDIGNPIAATTTT
jgi:hypothetical protein